MNKKFIFFDENTEITWWFDIISGNENLTEIELDDLIDDLIEDSHDYNGEDLESTYGVHDVAFNPETDILGFSSYEVGVYNCLPGGTEDRFQELMQKWRDIFKKRGYTTSTVYHEKIV